MLADRLKDPHLKNVNTVKMKSGQKKEREERKRKTKEVV